MMIIIVIASSEMTAYEGGVIMIHRSALILRIKIFYDNTVQPINLLQMQFGTKHHILEVVEEESAVFLHIPFRALTVAIIVKHEH